MTLWWVRAGVALGRRPDLWPAAAHQARVLVPRRWWRQVPPLPVPSPTWISFRMETAYGNPDARPEAADVVAFLEWARDTHGVHRIGYRRR